MISLATHRKELETAILLLKKSNEETSRAIHLTNIKIDKLLSEALAR